MSVHVALLGDSIFDNAAYTGGEPDVVTHLRGMLPARWRASLLAVDGATTRGLAAQLQGIPSDASHLVVSVGGNDALGDIDLLSLPVRSTAEALAIFGERVARFEAAYAEAIALVRRQRRPTTLCTIYNGNLEPAQARLARIALMMFNDVVLREAFAHASRVIDLRFVCDEPADYANPIEPSGRGGRKIAAAIAASLAADPASSAQSRVWIG